MKRSSSQRKKAAMPAALVTAALAAFAASANVAQAQITAANWGSVTSPVYGTNESGIYSDAELFAGPNKFGSYYSGVLPSGSKVIPAGQSVQIGMNPLGSALTPDGKYLITTNDDERNGNLNSLQNNALVGGYSITVLDTSTMTTVSQFATSARYFVGLQVTGTGPYTVWASGGGDNNVKLFTVGTNGVIAGAPATITIAPITPKNQGYVSNYTPAAGFSTKSVPSGFSAAGAKTTFPTGSALSPDGKFLYVACNGDNSLAVIDTTSKTVVKQVPVGYFPYGVAVSQNGGKVLVSNWGVTEYKFKNPSYDANGNLTALTPVAGNAPDGYYVPAASTPLTDGKNKTSSISIVNTPNANGANAALLGSIYEGQPAGLDDRKVVGETHPSALGIVRRGTVEVLYVAKANSDTIGLVLVNNNRKLADFDLSLLHLTLGDGHQVHGSYPNALVVSPDNTRVYVAEAGINSVAVLDTTNPTTPKLLGRIPTGWYPTGLSISPDGKTLYIVNAKGIGEDINPNASGNPTATGVASFSLTNFTNGVDSNYIFGSAQKVDLTTLALNQTTVPSYNYAVQPAASLDTSIVPIGGAAPSAKIKHVFFILHENKTFDSMLGNQSHFGSYASTTYNNFAGAPYTDTQFTPVDPNTQLLANDFATAVNYYSNSEESDAGHQFAASGTASDYTEKTLLVKSGRGLLVNKNFEPEDYPEGGYIFNNAARNGVDFKDFGALVRIVGTDTGTSIPTTIDDPASGKMGFPQLPVTNPITNVPNSDPPSPPTAGSPTVGLGQAYFMALPILSILGTNNPVTNEPRIDTNYPGYNFNISDQRRAEEFMKDFDRMVANNTLPKYVYIYQPNDHTGGTQANNIPAPTAAQEVADGDVGLGMVVNHILNSPVYYDAGTDTGSAIFITYDDAQSTKDHIHPHRTPMIVVSPYAKPGYVAKKHYVTASIVKTEELLMGLPPNNMGDLLATDLRDLFQSTYNGITIPQTSFTRVAKYTPTVEGRKVWALAKFCDNSGPDRDSARLGTLARLSMLADTLHKAAVTRHHLTAHTYQATQARIYQAALTLVHAPAPRDSDD